MAATQPKSHVVEMNRSLRGLVPFLSKNPHLFRVEKIGNCNLLIDGSNLCFALWEKSQNHPFLSDDASYANVVRNFFSSLRNANIEAYVFFLGPITEQTVQIHRNMERFNHLTEKSSNYQKTFTVHCRNVFGEIVADLGVTTLISEDDDDHLVSIAQSLDAILMSGNNKYFLKDLPRGYLNFAQLSRNFHSLRDGPMDLRMRLYKSSLLKNILRVGGTTLNSQVLPMMELLMKYDCCSALQQFVKDSFRLQKIPPLKLTPADKNWDSQRITVYFNILAQRSCNEAMTLLLASVLTKDRSLIRTIFYDVIKRDKEERSGITESGVTSSTDDSGYVEDETVGRSSKEILEDLIDPKIDVISYLWDGALQPLCGRLRSFENEIFHGGEDEQCEESRTLNKALESLTLSETDSDDDDTNDDFDAGEKPLDQVGPDKKEAEVVTFEYPEWVHRLLRDECQRGHRGGRFYWFIGVLIRGYFCSRIYAQNINEVSTYLSGLRIRRVIYGVLFKGRFNDEISNRIYVRELAYVGKLPVECRVRPSWEIPSDEDPADWMDVPKLDEIAELDTEYRERLFGTALTGQQDWLYLSGIDDPHYHFNLLFLKAWARWSHGLRRLDVVAFLLSVLHVEKLFGRMSRIFPWPVYLREASVHQLNKTVPSDPDLNIVHAFAHLQSMIDDASNLNAVLNSPFGRNVERIREFFSEKLFYLWSVRLADFEEDFERILFIESLFDADCDSFWNFRRLLSLLYVDEEYQSRAPLCLVPSSEVAQRNFVECTECQPFTEDSVNALKKLEQKSKSKKIQKEIIERPRA